MFVYREKSGVVGGLIVAALGLFPVSNFASSSARLVPPATVEIMPRAFTYRMAGDFYLGGKPIDAPNVQIVWRSVLRIMKRQVTAGEYDRCVAGGGCKQITKVLMSAPDLPVVNVSWVDATSYAAWLTKETGYLWRLPTDEEWAFAAGSRFHDDALLIAAPTDPSIRSLAQYEREAEAGSSLDRRPRSVGSFGENEYGLLDLSGNVWEWTNTCFSREAAENGTSISGQITNCGVRVAEGAHRAYVTDFIRDASNGGCAVGKPPSNLGFRLVRQGLPADLISKIKSLLTSLDIRSARRAHPGSVWSLNF